jgi:AGCS family alanine or glycine:cation symporter
VGVWLLIAVGLLMTILTRVFQVSHFGHWMKKTVGSLFEKKVRSHTGEKASISQFQALCTALAATVGVGNIAGVAGAIVTGGPGAVFWMWVAAFLGMMTNYSENVLGIFYRRKNRQGETVELIMVREDTVREKMTIVCVTGDIDEEFLCFLYNNKTFKN